MSWVALWMKVLATDLNQAKYASGVVITFILNCFCSVFGFK